MKWVRSGWRSIQTPISELKYELGETKTKIHSNTCQWTEIWTGWDRGKDPFRHQSVNWNMNWVRSRQRFIQTPVSDLKYELGEIKAKIHSNTGQWTEIWRGWDRGKDLFKQQSVNWNMIWVRSRLRSIWTLVSELKCDLGEIKVKIYLNTGQWTEIWSGWDQGKDLFEHWSGNWNMKWVRSR